MNTATFAGRTGGDAIVRQASGEPVMNFSLAVNRYKKDDGPLWVRVTMWGERVNKLSEYITKGREVVVSGSVDLKTYTDNEGTERTELTLNARELTLMGGGNQNSDGDRREQRTERRPAKQASRPARNNEEIDDSDILF